MSFIIGRPVSLSSETPIHQRCDSHQNRASYCKNRCLDEYSGAEPLMSSSYLLDVKEDDGCVLLSLDIPGVSGGNDIDVSIKAINKSRAILSIQGFRSIGRNNTSSRDGRGVRKRQRIDHKFSIDFNTSTVEVSRGTANVWNGVLTLYAPKRERQGRTG